MLLSMNRSQALEAFSTDEPFKAVAKRLGMSPNTLRRLWKERYGEAAFKERGCRIQQLGATAYGARTKGRAKARTQVEVQCSQCGKPFQVTRGQRAKARRLVCPSCSTAGKEVCPVCNLHCDGAKGLATHFRHQAEDPPHREWLAEREAAKWKGLTEGLDYVTCRVCGLNAHALTGHLRVHQLTAEEYRADHPDALVVASRVEARRQAALAPIAAERAYGWSREDLLKFCDEQGKVIVAEAAMYLKAAPLTVLHYCRSLGLPTRNRLAWQRAVLDKAAKVWGAKYQWEWSTPEIRNPNTGRMLNYDGYFPSLNLLLEAHGEQHFRYSEAWHGSLEAFRTSRRRDEFKKARAEELGYGYRVVKFTDPWDTDEFWEALKLGTPERPANLEDKVFHILRQAGFPRPEPNVAEAKKALTRLGSTRCFLDDDFHVRPYSIAGTAACASFFPNRYHAHYRGAKSAFEAWHDDEALRKAIRLQLDSGHPTTPERVLRALVMHHRTPSVFRPAVAKYVYQTYAPGGVVWDPCAGYGGRLMGAVAAGVERYVATEVEPETIEGNRALAQALGVTMCELHQEGAEGFDPGPVDLVFTSPPYLDLEVYGSASQADCSTWVDEFLVPVVHRAAQRLWAGGHLILNLPFKPVRGLRLDLEAKALAEREGLVEEPTVWMPVRAFRGPFKAEPLLVWRR